MRATLRALAVGNFTIGTGAFVVPGLLGPLASDLNISVATAGQLMTVYAVSYAIGSPLLVSLTSHIRRRELLLSGLAVFAVGTLLSAAATNVWLLFAARVLAACGAAVFTPCASTVAVMTSAPDARGKALGIVFFGLALAQVIGIPVGTLIAYSLGWRATFAVIGVLAIIVAFGLAGRIPRALEGQRVSLKSWAALLHDARVALALGVTLFQFAGQFIPYTYIGPWAATSLQLGATGISALLWAYGAASIPGGLIGGWCADRFGVVRTLFVVLIVLGLSIAGMSAASGSLIGVVAALTLWSAAGFAYNAPQQSRLVTLAPEALGIVLAVNASALYIGTAVGGAVGGLVVTHIGIDALGWVGGASVALAMLCFIGSASVPGPARR